jgi:MATE family multidrug resistance protein
MRACASIPSGRFTLEFCDRPLHRHALNRPARVRLELKNLLALALPIMIAQLATTAMGFVDAVMAGRVGPRDLAAVALGNRSGCRCSC